MSASQAERSGPRPPDRRQVWARGKREPGDNRPMNTPDRGRSCGVFRITQKMEAIDQDQRRQELGGIDPVLRCIERRHIHQERTWALERVIEVRRKDCPYV